MRKPRYTRGFCWQVLAVPTEPRSFGPKSDAQKQPWRQDTDVAVRRPRPSTTFALSCLLACWKYGGSFSLSLSLTLSLP